MAKERYQVIVIGGGASGMAAAIAALEEGMSGKAILEEGMSGKAALEERMPKEALSEEGVPGKAALEEGVPEKAMPKEAACGERGWQMPEKKQARVLLLESNDRVGKKNSGDRERKM